MTSEPSKKAQEVMSALSSEEAHGIIQTLVPHIANETRRLLMADHYFLASVSESVSRLQDASKKISEALKENTHWMEFAKADSICPYKWTIRFIGFEEATTEHLRTEPYLPLPFKEVVPEPTLENIGQHYTVFTREGNPWIRSPQGEFASIFLKIDELLLSKVDELYYYGADTVILRFPGDDLENRQEMANKARKARDEFRARNEEAANAELGQAMADAANATE